MNDRIMAAPELAAALGVSEMDLQGLAHSRRIPFAFSTTLGFLIQRRDLPVWKAAVQPADCCGD